MFKLKELKKLKQELLNSLIKESKSLIKKLPKEIKTKSELVLKDYIHTESIAGLELWINGVSEYLYFLEAQKDLTNLKNNPSVIKEFQAGFTESLKVDFGVEDFRFIDWERANANYPILNDLLNNFIDQTLIPCHSIQNDVYLGTNSDYTHFQKANGDPSVKGLKVKTILKKTPKNKMIQVQKANEYLEVLWSEGFELYKLLTDKVHIVQSNGLVSYSHFHEQGISYINFIDRDILESVDDLIHENSHHHLNLILKKYKIIKKDSKEDIFYSPWRKSLRPLYAILHATFTFSYGALLFYNLAKYENWTFDIDKERVYFRFIEETLAVAYSLVDLQWAIKNGHFTKKGINLIQNLTNYNEECIKSIPEIKNKIKSKEKKRELDLIKKNLEQNRNTYKFSLNS
ncbi:MAG: hypothetical protein KBF93_14915 [Leptospiraceae bacterium]|nr:hypothetical protein [Leptospiraceae bacterium]